MSNSGKEKFEIVKLETRVADCGTRGERPIFGPRRRTGEFARRLRPRMVMRWPARLCACHAGDGRSAAAVQSTGVRLLVKWCVDAGQRAPSFTLLLPQATKDSL
jgi:hypothetical protein